MLNMICVLSNKYFVTDVLMTGLYLGPHFFPDCAFCQWTGCGQASSVGRGVWGLPLQEAGAAPPAVLALLQEEWQDVLHSPERRGCFLPAAAKSRGHPKQADKAVQ